MMRCRLEAEHTPTKLSVMNANLATSNMLFYQTGADTHQHLTVSVSSAAVYAPVLFKIPKCGNIKGRGGQPCIHF